VSYATPLRHFPNICTYWKKKIDDGYGGEQWLSPEILACRWEDFVSENLSSGYKNESEINISNARVYLKVKLGIGDYLCFGSNLMIFNPTLLNNAYIIRSFVITPSVNGRYVEYCGIL
jgi:hypothetical protein